MIITGLYLMIGLIVASVIDWFERFDHPVFMYSFTILVWPVALLFFGFDAWSRFLHKKADAMRGSKDD